MSAPATKEISDWLEKLGMSEYAQRFAENDIDVSVLRHLTDQDLEELGICSAIGGKCLRAIGELGCRRASPRVRPQSSRSPKTPPSAAKSR